MNLDSMSFDGTNAYFNYTIGVQENLPDMQLKVKQFLISSITFNFVFCF